jgi:signal peptidase I
MEPTLQSGDILLVRKADLGFIPETIWNIITGGGGSAINGIETDQARLLRNEARLGLNEQVPLSRVYDCPPMALNGHIVVYKDPEKGIPNELCVKRVIGVGGQLVRPRVSPGKMQQLPLYSLHVEGDNYSKSRDSRQVGPISKGLLVGIAEYVLWPPTRMGRIQRRPVSDDKGRPRASWL